jgi:hypothetical protein
MASRIFMTLSLDNELCELPVRMCPPFVDAITV